MMLKTLVKKSFIFGMSISLMAPSFSYAFGEASTIQAFVGRQSVVPLIKPSWGDFILHTDRLNKLYQGRGYQAIWVNSNGLPNQMAASLKATLLAADRHGLNPSDYWDDDVEKLYNATIANQNNWITFELAASEAMIRFASHLSTGRFDPEQIDTDIKFKKKEFTEYNELLMAVNAGPQGLQAGLDRVAPNHPRYADLMAALAQLKSQKATGGWATINSPGFILKRGVKSPVIQKLRDRFNQLGYPISNNGGDVFDQEFEDVLKLYQSKNGLSPDGIIGTRSEVLRSMNYSVSQRIAQVETTMEKIRWLPKNIEQRHIFVNLATSEFRLQDESGQVFYFKTINGQPFRRTPSMRDLLKLVKFNPTWTVPHSIAIKDKLPLLQKDPNYLVKHNMTLMDANTDEPLDATTIDWSLVTPKTFTYYIRQNPGMDNALGVVKFPLTNPWAIYMHDTNERNLFAGSERHLSSGCVRLERPLDLAEYLLRDNPQWTRANIDAFLPHSLDERADKSQWEYSVPLSQPIPVYFMYLTVEKSETGALRFVDDVYGQDTRVAKALANKKDGEIKASMLTQNVLSGYLQVNGTPGKFQMFQKVKAVRCDTNQRGACDAPIVLDLNKPQQVPAGSYLVGFENSMYPGMVTVEQGRNTVLNLERVTVPSSVRGQRVRVYRDFTQDVEQQKMMLEMFAMNHHFNRLEKDNFGDLYLTGTWERDYVQRFTYEICPRLSAYGDVSPEAKDVCTAWNTAQSPTDLAPMYQFNKDGTFQELWVTYPGDMISSKHPRYLVSAPMTDSDFVAVFPGAYRVQAEGKNTTAVSMKVGNVQ